MIRLTIAAIAVVALLAAGGMMTRWPSTSVELASGTAAMPSLQELHVTADTSSPYRRSTIKP
ncbi:hypothetical protein [Bradyrhizobium canariense]|uniref:hypothetical protein n=1 Tax=Bradyrhizobium canariense TaxID=255045 RepID=UPI000A192B68|nr:hypothetical protein [Bradyrhizobium canariense]OSI23806.1 hypothetical protein BST65_21150 [Bradyrhizobium canariense]OSI39841.1 hypothetical protein BSZ20_28245 [Bradyrhizobium canariense]OSI48131.1 hypothetical protein BST67_18725 [Bradyrhizobium canariense]